MNLLSLDRLAADSDLVSRIRNQWATARHLPLAREFSRKDGEKSRVDRVRLVDDRNRLSDGNGVAGALHGGDGTVYESVIRHLPETLMWTVADIVGGLVRNGVEVGLDIGIDDRCNSVLRFGHLVFLLAHDFLC